MYINCGASKLLITVIFAMRVSLWCDQSYIHIFIYSYSHKVARATLSSSKIKFFEQLWKSN